MAIWVCADLHLNHYNIIDFEKINLKKNKLDYITTIEQYNNMIINHINEIVAPSDTLYILGDFAFGGTDKIVPLLRRINGNKILILGNHDHYGEIQAKKMGFLEAYSHPIYVSDEATNTTVILSHYPLQEALNNPYIYNIHGHIHGGYLDQKNFVNVNIAMNNYYPVSLDELFKKISGKMKSRHEIWLTEWYAPYQIFIDKTRTDIVLSEDGHLLLGQTKELKHAK